MRQISFSQAILFWNCPKTWYYKYILDVPREENLEFAHRGNVVHKCLEEYYPNKILSIEKIKDIFNEEWHKFKLDDTFMFRRKDESWNMIKEGINLNLNITQTELEIVFPEVKGYIDIVNTNNHSIYDWKTSTISEHNKKEYLMQLKFYAYLYYKKFNIVPNHLEVFYLKDTTEKLIVKPNLTDIKNVNNFIIKTQNKMQEFIKYPNKLPKFNTNYNWCPYKHLWTKEYKNIFRVDFDISGSYVYIKPQGFSLSNHPKLITKLKEDFSYELKNAYFIKKNCPMANTTVQLFNQKYNRMPIGFIEKLKLMFYEYAESNNMLPVIKVNDSRKFNETLIKMPDKLKSGKVLREYQVDAINKYINGPKISMIELTTGGGKTLILTEIIRKLAYKTLFIIDKKELMYQTKQTFEEELGIEVGVIGDGKKIIKDVTVCTIQTLVSKLEELKEYLSQVRFVIFDECHHIASNSYSNVCHYLKNTEHRLSVTATAKRTDGNEMVLEANGGPIVFSLTGQDLIEKGYLVKPNIIFKKINNTPQEILEMEQNSKQGLINEEPRYDKYYPNFIVNNIKRNELILQTVNENLNKQILILVKLIEHGEILNKIIPNSHWIYGETKSKLRTKTFNDFKSSKINILISTISIFAEGVDIPTLDVVINASANKGDVKTIQVLGRVLRKSENKTQALYYDMFDETTFFRSAALARMNAFKKEGYKIQIID